MAVALFLRAFLFTGVVAMCASGAAMHAASFDCSKPVSAMERAICSDGQLSSSDSAMALAYRRTLSLLPPEAALKFRDDQRHWLEALQQGCQIAGMEPVPAPPATAEIAAQIQSELQRTALCMRLPYAERIDVLKHGFSRVDGTLFLTRSIMVLSADSPPSVSATGAAVPTGFGRFPGFGSLLASWPEAQTADPHWVAWNAALLQHLQRLATPKSEAAAAGWQEAMAANADRTLTVLTPALAHGRVAVAVELDTMEHGAAHPAEQYVKDTWMLEAHRPLTPQDVFRPGVYWQGTVAAEAWNVLLHGEQSGTLYDKAAGPQNPALLDAVGDTGNWTLTSHGLEIHWPEYTLAPRYAGLEDTLIPWKVLEPVLNPLFTP